jgi:hypothetical protein
MQINGYTFESNINNWSNKYLSINSADVEPSVDSANIFQGIAKTSGVSTVNGVQYFTWNIQKDADSNLVLSSGRVYRPGISLFLFGPKTITITIRKTVDGGIANAGTTATFYIKYANEDVGTPWTIGVTEINAQVTHKFDAEGKTRSISIYAVINGTIISGCNFEVRVDFSDILPTNAGGVLVLSNRLGFETQFDFMKFFGQAFGLTFVVDEKTKHVSAYSLELLYDNIESGNVKDWSDKINGKDLSFGFTLKDYAQNNTIALQDSKDGITDSGEFQIDNDTLKYSKELFKLPVEAGKDITLNSGRGSQVACAMIPLVELKTVEESEFERGNELDYIHTITGATFPTVKPHLLELSEQTAEVTFVGELVNLQIAKHVKAQQIVDTGYSALKDRMLKNARMIEENLYLTPGDIERFDPSVPVYLEKYGYYFYVNKIKNFVAGKPTKVELIKL